MRSGWHASKRVHGGLVRRFAHGVRAEVWPGARHWLWCLFDPTAAPLAHGAVADCERAQDEAEDAAQHLIEESSR
jgi:hypothetical protein